MLICIVKIHQVVILSILVVILSTNDYSFHPLSSSLFPLSLSLFTLPVPNNNKKTYHKIILSLQIIFFSYKLCNFKINYEMTFYVYLWSLYYTSQVMLILPYYVLVILLSLFSSSISYTKLILRKKKMSLFRER